jgi:hypothetical protein
VRCAPRRTVVDLGLATNVDIGGRGSRLDCVAPRQWDEGAQHILKSWGRASRMISLDPTSLGPGRALIMFLRGKQKGSKASG